MKHLLTVDWSPDRPGHPAPGHIRAIDQARLPGRLGFLAIRDVGRLWRAIKTLQIRGAPAIGVAAAMGAVLAAQNSKARDTGAMARDVLRACDYLASCRPTAVNLFWALDRMKRAAQSAAAKPGPAEFRKVLLREAMAIFNEDRSICRRIGVHGLKLLGKDSTVLTHCNAGSLATAQYGTALAPVYLAKEQGRRVRVFADETRPLLQGARLTAWELKRAGIEVTLICDNMAAQVMKEGKIDCVFVGADRIAANGDTANKIGTYGLAVLAKAHGVPFYVLAPTSTFDLSLRTGRSIPIEQRSPDEITTLAGRRISPRGVNAYAPAFDVTPSGLISAIVCENGICRAPYRETLRNACLGRQARTQK